MKKLITLTIAAVALSMTACADSTYNVTGTLKNLGFEGETVYLRDYADNSVVDSTVVNEDGTYTFTGTVDAPRYVIFNANEKFFGMPILEPGTISFTEMYPEIGMAQSFGTPLNDKLKGAQDKTLALFNAMNEQSRSIENDDNLTEGAKGEQLINMVDSLQAVMKNISRDFINENNQNITSVIILEEIYDLYTYEEFSKMYDNMGTAQQQYPPLMEARTKLKAVSKTTKGEMYKDFTIENGNIDGTAVPLSDYVGQGKMVLVDFWASWCGPCIQEIPTLQAIYEKYGDEVTIVSVAVWDKRDATLKAIKEHNTPWEQIVDAQAIPTDIYGISSIPHIMLIGEDGSIIKRNIRGAQIEEAIKANLK